MSWTYRCRFPNDEPECGWRVAAYDASTAAALFLEKECSLNPHIFEDGESRIVVVDEIHFYEVEMRLEFSCYARPAHSKGTLGEAGE